VALILDPDAAVREVSSGGCVGVGGSINSGLDLDFLVAAGCAGTISAAYVGAEDIVGLPPGIRWAAEEGRIEVWESDEGIHLASLRARALKLPYTTWTGTLGTSAVSHPLVESAVDEATGMSYLKVRPLKVDAALVWAEAADEDGNLLLWGPDLGDEWLRNAADLRIAQVERIVPTAVLSRHPDRVMPWAAEIVVRAPLSTHPFGSTLLRPDEQWLVAYASAVAQARRAGEPARLEAFFDEWVRNVEGEDGYLDKVGLERLRALMI
jgi:acyl CoA:acetate/3-ketoacid CoA transferase alpha subunit